MKLLPNLLRRCIVLACAAVLPLAPFASIAGEVKVGLLGNLTGRAATSFGVPFKNGFELALADIAKSGVLAPTKTTIVVQPLDTNSEVTKAVTSFNQFAQQRLPIVVSDSQSPIGQAVAPLANDAKIAFISGAGSQLENKGGYAFRLADLKTSTSNVGKHLIAQGAKRVGAIVATDNPSFPTLAAGTLEGLGVNYVSTQNVTTKDSNFSAVLTNLKAANIDALVLSVLPEQAGNIIQQMVGAGMQNVKLAGTLATSPQTFTIAGKAATGLVFPQAWAPGGSRSAAFEAAYKQKYNATPTAYAGLGYQVAWLIAAAAADVEKAGKPLTGENLRTALPAASTGPLVAKHGILDLQLTPTGEAISAGTLARFADNGDIVSAGK
ncbi:ABC transporter substrate-binding protein [Ramlibacter sp.]|uniref:ABC transporter substrate-binding protein n=1 Tax=Ramlibacter sp. TaxID=1917967 RepID=UPI003D0BA080